MRKAFYFTSLILFAAVTVNAATLTIEDKNIIIVFSGSDWCAPCIKLDKNIWQSDAFKNQFLNQSKQS